MEQLLTILLMIFLSILFLFLTTISIFVYLDSRKRGMNSITWLLIIWLIPFGFGILTYLNNRKVILESDHNT